MSLTDPGAGATPVDQTAPAEYERLLYSFARGSPPPRDHPGLRIAIDPDDVKKGLGRLVLTLVELVRELLERQAARRVEAGGLSGEEIERLGITFLQLAEQVTALKSVFGLDGESLNLDLGPLGTLLDDDRG